jgi:hypothetical protein
MKKIITLVMLAALFAACSPTNQKEFPSGEWLPGDASAFVEAVERQFDGFSRTMKEVAYRYDELYWAGLDENWEYADYQLEHIEEAIEKGFERRPERRINSEEFLGIPTDLLQQAIDGEDLSNFERNFIIYTAGCNSCHMKEEVSFIHVVHPTENRSTVRRAQD